jgi:hypothetical protein
MRKQVIAGNLLILFIYRILNIIWNNFSDMPVNWAT